MSVKPSVFVIKDVATGIKLSAHGGCGMGHCSEFATKNETTPVAGLYSFGSIAKTFVDRENE